MLTICSRSLALVLLLAALPAQAAVIIDTFQAPGDQYGGGGTGIPASFESANFFTPATDTSLMMVELALSQTVPGADLFLNIWVDDAGLPGATNLASINIGLLVGSTASVVTVVVPSQPALLGGVTYWVGVDTSAGTSATWIDSLIGGSVSEPFRVSGGAWTPNSGTQGAFRVTSIPEPSTGMLVGFGLMALAAFERRAALP